MPLSKEELKILREESTFAENDEGAGISEAIQQAAAESKPDKTKNGRVRGVNKGKRVVTAKMRCFASLVAQGKSPREAYRTAYNVGDRKEHLIITGANRLMRDVRIQALTEDVWSSVAENIVDDAVATRRFVMGELKKHADNAKQDSAKLKALELMGRAVGMFTDKVESKVEEISTEKLKAELESSLHLLGETSYDAPESVQ